MKIVLYFGNIDVQLSRNKIYIDGLRQNGVKVLLCVDRAKGIRKYWNLYKKHKEFKGKYDALIVGYGGYVTVPLAKLISNKPVIFDALCSSYETEILSRETHKTILFRKTFISFIDWLANRFADKILIETDNQNKYFREKLKVKSEKLITVYTGVDDSVFYVDEKIAKFQQFTVLFRGRFMLEAGFKYIFKAIKELENKNINFLLIGYGSGVAKKEFDSLVSNGKPKNFIHIEKHLSYQELRELMLKCHVSLGWFNDNERVKRTIPHKIFESFSMKMPVITARAEGLEGILEDKINCFLVEAKNSEEIVEKIMFVKNNSTQTNEVVENAYRLYKERFSPKKVVLPIVEYLRTLK